MEMAEAVGMYLGRMFDEGDYYSCLNRQIYAASSNNVWLYSVDTVVENETGKHLVQVVRWQARGKKKSRTKYWQRRKTFNIRSQSQWYPAKEIVDRQVAQIEVGRERFLEQSDEGLEVLSHSEEISELRAEVGEKEALAKHHQELSRRYRSRLRDIKIHIRQYRGVLKEFEGLVNCAGITETQVHDFLEREKAYWVFGLEYVDLESKVRFPPDIGDFQFDLMLRRVDSFHDLVELKGPDERLFNAKTKRRAKLNRALGEALMQVIVYLDACARSSFKEILKPKAIIVIGKGESDSIVQRRLLQSHLAGVEILTYDDLVARGTMLLDHLDIKRRRTGLLGSKRKRMKEV